MLKDMIFKRKSTRKYNLEPLPPATLQKIAEFAQNLRPLYPEIHVEYEFVTAIKNLLPIKAPHYIIISSEIKEGYLTNVGFMFQQMSLYLSKIGLGNCWLGMARPAEKLPGDLEFVIILSFGKPLDTPYRRPCDFDRKQLSEIANVEDQRLEVARLAPSATNSQPWYFVVDGDTFHVYREKLSRVKGLIYDNLNQIDVGLALAHLYVANEETFKFFIQKQELDGYTYLGSFTI